jgi:hypothetical protein
MNWRGYWYYERQKETRCARFEALSANKCIKIFSGSHLHHGWGINQRFGSDQFWWPETEQVSGTVVFNCDAFNHLNKISEQNDIGFVTHRTYAYEKQVVVWERVTRLLLWTYVKSNLPQCLLFLFVRPRLMDVDVGQPTQQIMYQQPLQHAHLVVGSTLCAPCWLEKQLLGFRVAAVLPQDFTMPWKQNLWVRHQNANC